MDAHTIVLRDGVALVGVSFPASSVPRSMTVTVTHATLRTRAWAGADWTGSTKELTSTVPGSTTDIYFALDLPRGAPNARSDLGVVCLGGPGEVTQCVTITAAGRSSTNVVISAPLANALGIEFIVVVAALLAALCGLVHAVGRRRGTSRSRGRKGPQT
ncbi:MAG: hypothetical protein QOE89_2184 [Pseudonocardiales bacterium]|nr:hypothetical protein [Pseudonocardiales bacterium]